MLIVFILFVLFNIFWTFVKFEDCNDVILFVFVDILLFAFVICVFKVFIDDVLPAIFVFAVDINN